MGQMHFSLSQTRFAPKMLSSEFSEFQSFIEPVGLLKRLGVGNKYTINIIGINIHIK